MKALTLFDFYHEILPQAELLTPRRPNSHSSSTKRQGRIDWGGLRQMIGDPTRPRTMSEVALRVPDEHLAWDRLLRPTLRFADAPAAPVTAADIDRDWGSDLRTR